MNTCLVQKKKKFIIKTRLFIFFRLHNLWGFYRFFVCKLGFETKIFLALPVFEKYLSKVPQKSYWRVSFIFGPRLHFQFTINSFGGVLRRSKYSTYPFRIVKFFDGNFNWKKKVFDTYVCIKQPIKSCKISLKRYKMIPKQYDMDFLMKRTKN